MEMKEENALVSLGKVFFFTVNQFRFLVVISCIMAVHFEIKIFFFICVLSAYLMLWACKLEQAIPNTTNVKLMCLFRILLN